MTESLLGCLEGQLQLKWRKESQGHYCGPSLTAAAGVSTFPGGLVMHRNLCTNLCPVGSCSKERLIQTDLPSPSSPGTSGRNLMKLNKGKCSVLSLDGVIPHTGTDWGIMCKSTVSSWSFPSTKKTRMCWSESSSMKPRWAGAGYSNTGWELSLFSLKTTADRSYYCLQISVEKDRASHSSEMHAKRMKVNRYTVPQEKFWLNIWKIGLLPEWSNTGSSCLERLWNLHLLRYPRGYSPTQLWSRSGLPSGVEFQSSLPT